MKSKNSRFLTGTTNQPANTDELTFPAHLIHPPQSQLTRSEDAVSNRIAQFDTWAQQLGQGFGISSTSFVLNPPEAENDAAASTLLLMLRALAYRQERVSLERRSGRWGLYFTREPAIIAQERRAEAVSLKDAPLDVRERFLIKSEQFFRGYLKLCEDRLGQMQGSVAKADQTLKLLSTLHLD
jgi:hypothetical protein